MTEFAQLLVKGAALGAVYALVALGFVVVFKATGVLNFAQGALLLIGVYLAFTAAVRWDLPFPLAVVVAVAGAVAVGLLVERVVVRPLARQPALSVVTATFGVAIVLEQVVTLLWGFDPHHVGDPWGARSVRWAGIVVSQVDLATLVLAGGLVAGLAVFFARTRPGLALRAAASDPEAARALGVPGGFASRSAWALAAAVATVAGVLLASGPGAASPDLGDVVLRAFPAVLLGGFASLEGALAGGMVIGVAEVLTAGYAPGQELVVPALIMLAVALARPDGLFAR